MIFIDKIYNDLIMRSSVQKNFFDDTQYHEWLRNNEGTSEADKDNHSNKYELFLFYFAHI